jgi:F-type H+-transporting ATPase subunit delta
VDRIVGYAQALFHLAEAEEALDQVSDELFRFAKVVEQNYDLRTALTDIALPADRKEAILDELLPERTTPATRNILKFVVSQGRARELTKIVESLSQLAAEARQREIAEVRSAVPLDEAQKQKLAEALKRATGKTVEVKAIVDPAVLGGVYAKVGDQVIDGTVRNRLQSLKERLDAQG